MTEHKHEEWCFSYFDMSGEKMNEKLLSIAIALIILATVIAPVVAIKPEPTVTAAVQNPNAGTASIWVAINDLIAKVAALQTQINSIPAGPKGDTGATGPMGPSGSTGPAGTCKGGSCPSGQFVTGFDSVGNLICSSLPGTPCGDGTCSGAETCSSCPTDCGVCPPSEPPALAGILERHNFYRDQVGVQHLVWSSELATIAQQWADNKVFAHNPNRGATNENLALGPFTSANQVVDLWAIDEKACYNYQTNTCNSQCSTCFHYLNIIMGQTTEIGCGKADIGSDTLWVCNYRPM